MGHPLRDDVEVTLEQNKQWTGANLYVFLELLLFLLEKCNVNLQGHSFSP